MNYDIYHYNDYELLYLTHSMVDEAQELLFWKYSFLIKNRIKQFNIKISNYDDYYQEGLLTLTKAINTFTESSLMSFTNYFDLLLKRRFINILKKEAPHSNLIMKEDFNDLMDLSNSSKECHLNLKDIIKITKICGLSKLEHTIFNMYYLENRTINFISDKLNLSSKNVSNAKQRIIKKIKHYV